MKLHIFNPEHDLALAANLENFTPPHAARVMRAGLGFLPAVWADSGDMVLVDDVDFARKAWHKLLVALGDTAQERRKHVNFADYRTLPLCSFDDILPSGWDLSLRHVLGRLQVEKLPTALEVAHLRNLSHRASALPLLKSLCAVEGTVGEAVELCSEEDIACYAAMRPSFVIKAPWSCSGRGVRFVDGPVTGQLAGWLRNTLRAQGSVMVEPYYKKVKDFAMEFERDAAGRVRYAGLSLFHTLNGAYTGNILATERRKRELISRYVSGDMLDVIKEKICLEAPRLLKDSIVRQFGVDMMVVTTADRCGFLVHPCVEVNLRRTMGHVALALSPDDDDIVRVMRIDTNQNYLINIQPLRL